MRLSVTHGLPLRAVLVTLCLGLGACKDEAAPKKVDADEPLVKRPRKPQPRKDSPFRNPDEQPPDGRDGPQVSEAEIEAALARSKEARDAGDQLRARDELSKCANKTPASARCDGEQGLLLAEANRRKAEALYYLLEAARIDDPKAEAGLYVALSHALRRRGEFQAAAAAAEFALAREESVATHLLLGRALQSVPDELARAAEHMGKAFALEPENFELLLEQATLLGQIGDPEHAARAADLFRQYLERGSPTPQVKEATELRIKELQSVAASGSRSPGGAKKKKAG